MSEQITRKRIYQDYLDDIKTSITEILEFTGGMSFQEFFYDRKMIKKMIADKE